MSRTWGSPAEIRWIASPRARTHATLSSRTLNTSAARPPGRSTRCISDSARMASNQWNACATTMASTDALGSPIDSAVPSTVSTPGAVSSSLARIASTGSIARIRAPDGPRRRVSLPVPAPSSSSVRPGARPSVATIASTASGG